MAEYGEKELGYKKSHITNFIKVSDEYPQNYQTIGNLGVGKLLALTKLDQEEREEFIHPQG